MRPPGGRVGRGPGWSPGPEPVGSVARNGFPVVENRWRRDFFRSLLGPAPRANAQIPARSMDVMTAPAACTKTIPMADKLALPTAMPGVVQVIETHMAFVFLTADRALKLKKPVRPGYADHRTLIARATTSTKEVRLNRVLAGGGPSRGVSHGLGANRPCPSGRWARCGLWPVRMRRLPASRAESADHGPAGIPFGSCPKRSAGHGSPTVGAGPDPAAARMARTSSSPSWGKLA